jgi:hypothetical protein
MSCRQRWTLRRQAVESSDFVSARADAPLPGSCPPWTLIPERAPIEETHWPSPDCGKELLDAIGVPDRGRVV